MRIVDIDNLITIQREKIETMQEVITAGEELAENYEALAKELTEEANELERQEDFSLVEVLRKRLEANQLRHNAALIDQQQLEYEIAIEASEQLIVTYKDDNKNQEQMKRMALAQIKKDQKAIVQICDKLMSDERVNTLDRKAASGIKNILTNKGAGAEKKMQAFRDFLNMRANYKI